MLSRRDLVGKITASTAVVWAANLTRPVMASIGANKPEGAATRSAASPQVQEDAPSVTASAQATTAEIMSENGPAPWGLLRPLTLGAEVAYGWRLAGLTEVSDGSCVLTLQNDRGRTHRVHLCRNDGRPQGLVYTDHLDLVVMNGGQGDLPTDEGLAQAVAQVAHVLATNENRQQPVVVALLPHAERLRMFGDGEHARLR